MRLKNKKTGEIGYLVAGRGVDHYVVANNEWDSRGKYDSLAELSEEWEDAPEVPKEYWYIDDAGVIQVDQVLSSEINMRKSIGNYFESKEEADKAVEKLKAWKRLKDNGFRFIDWELDMKTVADGKIWFDVGTNTEWDAEQLLKLKPEVKESLDILFGGEE